MKGDDEQGVGCRVGSRVGSSVGSRVGSRECSWTFQTIINRPVPPM